MPKRSNDFQRLIYLVRVNLAEGAEVSESKMMRDRLTKNYREVDVVIRGKVGSQAVVISIECRDHKRVADVGWIDAMKTKHDRLETNVLLLASSAGFTKEAKEVANKYGIELFTVESQETADLSGLIGTNGSLWHQTCEIAAGKVSITVGATDDLEREVVACSPDNLIYLRDGKELCQVQEVVAQMLRSDEVANYMRGNGREEHKFFEFVWESPRDSLDRILCMQKLEPSVLRPVESIRVVGPCKITIGKFGMRHGRIGSIRIAWGKSVIAGRDAMAVATITAAGDKKISVNVRGAPGDSISKGP